jgi:hypothetical protein
VVSTKACSKTASIGHVCFLIDHLWAGRDLLILIGSTIADFYCVEAGLVVEVDGSIHDESEQREKDRRRNLAIENHGPVISFLFHF